MSDEEEPKDLPAEPEAATVLDTSAEVAAEPETAAVVPEPPPAPEPDSKPAERPGSGCEASRGGKAPVNQKKPPRDFTLDEPRVNRLVIVIMAAVSLVMVLFHMQPSSRENANTGSRYATIEALVDFGTFNIDESRYIFTP